MAGNSPQHAYINRILPHAERIGAMYNINPQIIIAQMAMENKWGQSILPNSFNHGNVNEFRKNVDGVWANDAGNRRKFRIFKNDNDFFDYLSGLYGRKYSGIKGMTDPYAVGHYLHKAGYAENKNYGKDLAAVYNSVVKHMPGYKWNGTPTTSVPVPTNNGSIVGSAQMNYGSVQPTSSSGTPTTPAMTPWQHQQSGAQQALQRDMFDQQSRAGGGRQGAQTTFDTMQGINYTRSINNALNDFFQTKHRKYSIDQQLNGF